MKASPAKKSRTELRRRHQGLFSELEVFLNAYLNSLKRTEATVPVRSNRH